MTPAMQVMAVAFVAPLAICILSALLVAMLSNNVGPELPELLEADLLLEHQPRRLVSSGIEAI
jgi:hypothetical protein